MNMRIRSAQGLGVSCVSWVLLVLWVCIPVPVYYYFLALTICVSANSGFEHLVAPGIGREADWRL